MRIYLSLFLIPAALAAVPGDAARGEAVLKSQRCLTCHQVNGVGGSAAPDLGRRTGRAYTPALMVSLMWNHAPQMWQAMEAAGIAKPDLDEQQAADLFAYFYSLRYFEEPGDGGRGKQVFVRKRCAICHSPSGGAPPVEKWPVVEDPLELARALWNHAPKMLEETRRRGFGWPAITAQEMTDLTVYLSALPRATRTAPALRFGSVADGRTVFERRGCSGCHHGELDLRKRPDATRRTLATFAAGMWSHAPKMQQPSPQLSQAEMRALIGYLWSEQFFEASGNPGAGESQFAKKGCAGCHTSGPGPTLTGRGHDTLTMASALWKHGPAMLAEMKSRNAKWPRFEQSELLDLLAYLNQKPQRR